MPFILNEDVKINYAVEGDGDCLVLQHGLYGSMEDWYEYGYVDALKKKFRLILIDARGHGKSDKPHNPDQYTLYRRALDVIKVLEALKIGKSHYMGYSMGGWISFGLMKWFSQRFQSFILDAIHPYENDMLSIREGVKTLDTWVPQNNISNGHKQRMLNNDKEALLAAVATKRDDHTELLRNMTKPCLMMDGEADAIFEKVKESSKLSELIKFVSIPAADHVGSMCRSEIVIPHIVQFIDGLHNT